MIPHDDSVSYYALACCLPSNPICEIIFRLAGANIKDRFGPAVYGQDGRATGPVRAREMQDEKD
jgi:hypothetical protein